jgi:MFS transporter, DHA3 family, macrolide efflux protein
MIGVTGIRRSEPDGGSTLRTFFLIVFGQLVSNLGSRLTDFGLGVWIFQQTHSPTQFALSILVSALPRIVFGPVIGAFVDRFDRRKVMLISDTVLAIRTALILAVLSFGGLAVWQIYIVNAVGSLFETSHGLAWSASTSLLVPKKHLSRVNGLTGMMNSGAGMLAPAIAGVLYVVIGLRGIAVVDLASWVFAVAPLLFVVIPAPVRQGGASASWQPVQAVREGWKYLRGARGLFYLLLAYSAINFFGITTEVLRGPYVLSFNGVDRFGLVESIVSIGALAGGLLLTLLGNPKRVVWLILGAEFLISIVGAVMGAFPNFMVLVITLLVYYATVSFCDGTINAMWQRTIPPNIQGRVFALRDTLNMSLMPVGILLFSPLAEYWLQPSLNPGGRWAESIGAVIGTGPGRGIGFLFVVSGVVSALIVVLAAFSGDIRRADRNDAADYHRWTLCGRRKRVSSR